MTCMRALNNNNINRGWCADASIDVQWLGRDKLVANYIHVALPRKGGQSKLMIRNYPFKQQENLVEAPFVQKEKIINKGAETLHNGWHKQSSEMATVIWLHHPPAASGLTGYDIEGWMMPEGYLRT